MLVSHLGLKMHFPVRKEMINGNEVPKSASKNLFNPNIVEMYFAIKSRKYIISIQALGKILKLL